MGGGPVTLLVTRPQPDAAGTIVKLRALGIEAIAAPLLIRRTLAAGLPDPDQIAALAITSVNALRSLEEGRMLARYRHLPLFAIGGRSAAAARQLGFAIVHNAGGGLPELIALLEKSPPRGPVLYPAAQQRVGALAPAGVTVLTVPLYQMAAATTLDAPIRAAILSGDITGALFYSRRTAQAFVSLGKNLLPPAERARLAVLCLSTRVAEPLIAAGYSLGGIAAAPDDAAMMALALAVARGRNTP